MAGGEGGRSARWGRTRERESARDRRVAAALTLEPLEGRQLLSGYSGFSRVRNILTASGIYNLQINGPGILRTNPAGNGSVDLKVLGTSTTSTLTVTQVRPRYHAPNALLSIRNLTVRSGQIGSIIAAPMELDGTMTPLTTALTTLQFGGLGPAAQVDVSGGVGSMSLGDVVLGPTGHVVIAGDVTGSGTTTTTSSGTSTGTGTVTINGTVTGTITATGSGSSTTPVIPLTAGQVNIDRLTIDGGEFRILGDSVAPIQIQGSLSLSRNGVFIVARDQTGSMTVGGSIVIDSGGQLQVGRNLSSLTVGGDVVINPGASGILVGGDLGSLAVNGVLRGQGSPSAVDLAVGLNLNGLSVLGGGANQGGIQGANISVGKNLSQVNVPHGIFRSWITAGVAINGAGGSGSSAGGIGADGVIAIYNSEIDAGTSITNLTVGGDVKSGFPTGDATGYPTRIIAGKVRSADVTKGPDQGTYLPNGSITGLQINGALIDAVLAASVAPYGGNGTLPPATAYGAQPPNPGPPPAGFSNYQAPGGLTDASTPNYSIRDVVAGQPVGPAHWGDGVVPHATILNNGTIVATVSGGVISTAQGDQYDFAGVYAVNTVGVNGAPQP
jgi:hypothetical protein